MDNQSYYCYDTPKYYNTPSYYQSSRIEPEKLKYLPINLSPAWILVIFYWVIAFVVGIIIPYLIGYIYLKPCRLPGQYS